MDKNSKKIAVTHNEDYNQKKISEAIEKHFEMLGVSNMLNSKTRVLIKPNLLMKRRPNEFTTTHPSLIIGIAEALKKRGVSKIVLADSPGGPYNKAAVSGIYEVCGMKSAAEKAGFELNYDFGSFERKTRTNRVLNSFTIINPIAESDFIIDVGKLKTHAMTNMSGAVKNLFGTIPGLMKPEFHWRFPDKKLFCDMLVELCETINPDICIIDAVTAMEGDGPSGGTEFDAGMIVSSTNPYNLDLALTKIIGINPDDVFTVAKAKELGYSIQSADKLSFVGDELKTYKFKLPNVKSLSFYEFIPKPLRAVSKLYIDKFLTTRPVIRKKDCIGCGKCAESCPAKTINIIDRKAVIDYSKCIKCFCCHEMCPVKAIDIKRSRILDI